MRVAIDARKLHDFGIGTYIRNLLRHLARIDTTNEYVLLCHQPDLDMAATLGPNFRTVLEPSPNYSVREQFHVPLVLRRERPDVYHAPHYVLPPAVSCASVVTIHDCIHLMFPQYLPSRVAYAYARSRDVGRGAAGAARSSRCRRRRSATSCTSSTCRRRRWWWCHNAIDERFLVPPPDIELARVRERYQLQHGFVLYAGNIKPHKNLVRLIEAFSQIRQGPFQELKLLIIGDQISKLPALRRAVHQLKLHKHVRFLGYIPDETLAVLYRSAEVFVFPSLYEGFGLPPLEAMASGTPVVTSNTSSLPEVTGGAAVLVDPYDVGSIVDGVRRVLTDPSLAAELRRKGPLRAREFSWARSVAKTRALYETVAGRRRVTP